MWKTLRTLVGRMVDWLTAPAVRSIVAVPGIDRHGDGFLCELVRVASALDVEPDWLAAVMSFESGVKPEAVNVWCLNNRDCAPDCCATGLIQFMPGEDGVVNFQGTSVTTRELREMSAIDQLSYVEAFYAPYAARLTDVGDMYLATFMPAALSESDDFVLGRRDDSSTVWGLSRAKIYEQNQGLDAHNRGIITTGDVREKLRDYYGRYADDVVTFQCPPATTEPVRKEVPLGGRNAIGGGMVILVAGLAALAIGRLR